LNIFALFFVVDRGVFKIFIHKNNVKNYCYELQRLPWIQKFNLLRYFIDGILREKIVIFRSVQGRARWPFPFTYQLVRKFWSHAKLIKITSLERASKTDREYTVKFSRRRMLKSLTKILKKYIFQPKQQRSIVLSLFFRSDSWACV
jgi:hypothetical protein